METSCRGKCRIPHSLWQEGQKQSTIVISFNAHKMFHKGATGASLGARTEMKSCL